MYMRILAQRTACQGERTAKEREDKPKYEYDSDEDTEGGTWEHKKRKAEMRDTEGLDNVKSNFNISQSFVGSVYIIIYFFLGGGWGVYKVQSCTENISAQVPS